MAATPVTIAPSNGGGGSASLYSETDSTFDALSKITADDPVVETTSTMLPEPVGAPVTTTTSPDGATAAVTAPAIESWLESAPKELQALMGQQNLSKESKEFLKSLYTETSAYRDFGSQEDVKTFRELFPGGMAEAKEIAGTVTQAMRSNQLFDSGDPEQQATLFGELATENPAAFLTASQVALDLVRQQMPSEFGQIRGLLAAEHLQSIDPNFKPFMDHLAQLAQNGQMEELAKRALELGTFWAKAGEKFFPKAAEAQPKANVLENPEVQQLVNERREIGINNMVMAHDETVNPIFAAEITKEAKARGLNLSEARIAKLAKQMNDEFSGQLQQDRNYQLFLDRMFYKGNKNDARRWDISPATRDKIKQHLAQRTKQVASPMAAKTVGEWIEQLKEAGLGNAPVAADTTAAAAIRGGTRSAPAGGGLNEEKLKSNKTTLELLNEL